MKFTGEFRYFWANSLEKNEKIQDNRSNYRLVLPIQTTPHSRIYEQLSGLQTFLQTDRFYRQTFGL